MIPRLYRTNLGCCPAYSMLPKRWRVCWCVCGVEHINTKLPKPTRTRRRLTVTQPAN